MRSDYLRTLVESIRSGSFAKAADILCITQSAVSRRIKYLEDECGQQLVDRSGSLLALTEAGKAVYEKAHRMLQLETELLRDLQGLAARQELTFCCTPSFGHAYLPEIIRRFMHFNPDISELKISFDTPDKVVAGLHKGDYQAGVVEHGRNIPFGDLITWELPGDEVVFVSSPRSGLDADVISLEDLLGHDLHTRKEGCCSSELLEHNLKCLGRSSTEFGRVIHYDDLHLIVNAVLEGHGIAFISRAVVERLARAGSLRIHHVSGFRHSYRRTLVVNGDMEKDRRLADFVNGIRAAFNEVSARGGGKGACCSDAPPHSHGHDQF